MYRDQVAGYCSVVEEIFGDRSVHGYLYFADASREQSMVHVYGGTQI
jgi:hypothetical protein